VKAKWKDQMGLAIGSNGYSEAVNPKNLVAYSGNNQERRESSVETGLKIKKLINNLWAKEITPSLLVKLRN
jgi:hypothetical protein